MSGSNSLTGESAVAARAIMQLKDGVENYIRDFNQLSDKSHVPLREHDLFALLSEDGPGGIATANKADDDISEILMFDFGGSLDLNTFAEMLSWPNDV